MSTGYGSTDNKDEVADEHTMQVKPHGRSGHSHGSNEHSSQDGTFKAAVFGFSDGLCTNVNVILGMYAAVSGTVAMSDMIAAEATRHIITLTGICGLLGGASSMACGEWLSDSAEKAANTFELAREKWHHSNIPETEDRDMHEMLTEFGLSKDTCDSINQDLKNMPLDQKVAFHARFELGIEEDDVSLLSSLKNALFMWLSFAFGALIPLLPWIVAPASWSLNLMFIFTLVFTAIAVLVTSFAQAYQINQKLFSPLSMSTFTKQVVVVALAVGLTVGLNILITGDANAT